jgi:RNA polymerase sigma factor (sigma-70 family)
VAWVMTIGQRMPSIGADAFETLFLTEYARVRAIAARTGLDAHEAEDVTQEAFVQFHRRHPADAPYAAAWVRRAAAHLALNAIRSRQRRVAREEREAHAVSAATASAGAGMNPQQAVEDEERRREVRAVMARLSTRHASILALRYSGMSYAEIAETVGVPPTHIGTLLRRAEIAFKKEFDHASSR